MKCRNHLQYLSWLNSVAISLKPESALLFGEESKREKEITLPNVIPRNQTHTTYVYNNIFPTSTLFVKTFYRFYACIKGYTFLSYISYCDKYFIWMHAYKFSKTIEKSIFAHSGSLWILILIHSRVLFCFAASSFFQVFGRALKLKYTQTQIL